jgi:hypothetical protein
VGAIWSLASCNNFTKHPVNEPVDRRRPPSKKKSLVPLPEHPREKKTTRAVKAPATAETRLLRRGAARRAAFTPQSSHHRSCDRDREERLWGLGRLFLHQRRRVRSVRKAAPLNSDARSPVSPTDVPVVLPPVSAPASPPLDTGHCRTGWKRESLCGWLARPPAPTVAWIRMGWQAILLLGVLLPQSCQL